jgi:D-glycero-alpha-D-manno-heptose 1-phosphate guanylyltransferase
MHNEVIILAGGLGTRLKGVISDIPKPMAPIGSFPFLCFLFKYLKQYNVNKVILAVGYKYENIELYFGNSYLGISITYAIENEPLGTGGAIANALNYAKNNNVFLLNGDTFFAVNLNHLYQLHIKTEAQLTLSLKPMCNFKRYGTVEVNHTKIITFNEKKPLEKGLINGGVYVLNKSLFEQTNLPQKFSFETDIMENGVSKWNMQAYISNGYFIDIGIPEDYEKAQSELPEQFLSIP